MNQESPSQVSRREGRQERECDIPSDDRGENIKESIELYDEGNNEQLLRIVRGFKIFVNTYDLSTERNEASVYGKFRRVLKEDTKNTWDELVTGETLSGTNFDIHLVDLVTDELGTGAFKYHVKYLKKTKKPGNLTLTSWMKRVRILNSYLPLLKVGEIKLTEEYFLEKIILKNILVRRQKEYDLKGIDETNIWAEVQAFLIKYEEHLGEIQAHLTDQNPRNSSNPNSRAQTQGNEQVKGKDNNKK